MLIPNAKVIEPSVFVFYVLCGILVVLILIRAFRYVRGRRAAKILSWSYLIEIKNPTEGCPNAYEMYMQALRLNRAYDHLKGNLDAEEFREATMRSLYRAIETAKARGEKGLAEELGQKALSLVQYQILPMPR